MNTLIILYKAKVRLLSTSCFHLVIIIIHLYSNQCLGQISAFPGAEGFGKFTTGGRGGKVLFVDNLNDSGPGSFREAAQLSGPRYIIFRVGGTIKLQSPINVKKDVTIAGQTAPGDGILITGYPISMGEEGNYIVRGLRIRIGKSSQDTDALQIVGTVGSNVIIDHCSMSWATDGNLDINSKIQGSSNITVQNCIIAECLRPHSLSLLVMGWKKFGKGPTRISILKNYMANNDGRNPSFGNGSSGEVFNNLVYNWGKNHAIQVEDGTRVNIVGNYFKVGPDSGNRSVKAYNYYNNGPSLVYVYDNIGPDRPDDTTHQDSVVWVNEGTVSFSKTPVEPLSENVYLTALEARDYVLDNAGAFPRDAVDRRLVKQFTDNTGKIISSEEEVGGFPSMQGTAYPQDTDSDGVPDNWELEANTDPYTFDADRDFDGDGYTNIENYINSFY